MEPDVAPCSKGNFWSSSQLMCDSCLNICSKLNDWTSAERWSCSQYCSTTSKMTTPTTTKMTTMTTTKMTTMTTTQMTTATTAQMTTPATTKMTTATITQMTTASVSFASSTSPMIDQSLAIILFIIAVLIVLAILIFLVIYYKESDCNRLNHNTRITGRDSPNDNDLKDNGNDEHIPMIPTANGISSGDGNTSHSANGNNDPVSQNEPSNENNQQSPMSNTTIEDTSRPANRKDEEVSLAITPTGDGDISQRDIVTTKKESIPEANGNNDTVSANVSSNENKEPSRPETIPIEDISRPANGDNDPVSTSVPSNENDERLSPVTTPIQDGNTLHPGNGNNDALSASISSNENVEQSRPTNSAIEEGCTSQPVNEAQMETTAEAESVACGDNNDTQVI